MREAHIRCMARRHMISDLDLRLVEGQTVILPEKQAKGSADLRHAKQIGAVSVVYVQRAKVTKPKKAGRKKPLQRWDNTRPSKSNLPPPPEEVFKDALSAFEDKPKKPARKTSTRKTTSRKRTTPKTEEKQDE